MKDVPMVVYPDPRKQAYAPGGGAALGDGAAPAAPPRLRPVVFPKNHMSMLNVVQSPGAPPPLRVCLLHLGLDAAAAASLASALCLHASAAERDTLSLRRWDS